MKAISAIDKNRGIGINGKIPWYIPLDFKWFKEFTMNQTLIVGRTTFEKLPPLKGRNIVLIYNTLPDNNHVYYHSQYRDKFQNLIMRTTSEFDPVEFPEAIVAGGAKTYELLLPHVNEFYVTHVNGEYEADTYMPKFEHLFQKTEVVREFEGGHQVIKYSK
jgi:dihydrofolate reductase